LGYKALVPLNIEMKNPASAIPTSGILKSPIVVV